MSSLPVYGQLLPHYKLDDWLQLVPINCNVRYMIWVYQYSADKSKIKVFTFWVPCCDVRYHFRIKNDIRFVFKPPVDCMRARVLCTSLVLFEYSGVQHILCCVFALFVIVLCHVYTRCQFLWIFHSSLPLRYSLTFIHNGYIKKSLLPSGSSNWSYIWSLSEPLCYYLWVYTKCCVCTRIFFPSKYFLIQLPCLRSCNSQQYSTQLIYVHHRTTTLRL